MARILTAGRPRPAGDDGDDGGDKALACLGALVAGAVLIPLTLVVVSGAYGFTLYVLWGWFITPVFNAPALGVLDCVGLALMMSFFRNGIPSRGLTPEEAAVEFGFFTRMGLLLLSCVLALAWGWVVHAWGPAAVAWFVG